MQTAFRLIAVPATLLLLIGGALDERPLASFLIGEAHAIIGAPLTPLSYAGVARRTTRRAVVYSSAARETVVVSQPVVSQPAVSHSAIPVGTVVTALPGQCSQLVANNVTYSNCGGVYYKAAFQGSNLVFVVVDKP